jgi:hypothetical protein
VTICPNELKTALAGVKRELPIFALTGEGSSKAKIGPLGGQESNFGMMGENDAEV